MRSIAPRWQRHFSRALMALGATAAFWACASLQWQPLGPRRTADVPGAETVGAKECAICHVEVQGHRTIATYHADCESCHGGGSPHVDTESWDEIRFPDTEDCLACHSIARDTHLQWGSGEHARAGLICSDCHNPHSTTKLHLREQQEVRFPFADRPSQLCVQCHPDVAAQLDYPSHHPVREGMLGCLSCHDPHEDRRARVGDANQLCAECHQDIMGPWIYEHPPVIEDCQLCHSPHGAPTDDLLTTPTPTVCLSCHPVNDLWHHDVPGTGIITNQTIDSDYPTDPAQWIKNNEATTFLRRCNDCHGAIHGSYTDEHLRH